MSTAALGSPGSGAAEQSWNRNGMLVVFGIALASFVMHMVFNGRYGYFRDEFDYIICGRHPAWGYVDQPPLLPILSRICLAVFGDSLRSVRLIPALSASALMVVTGLVTRELGGTRFAVALSALTILIAPIYLSGGSLLTSNCDLEVLLWTGCLYFAILAAKRNEPRYWLWFGVVAGIGLEEKYSIAVLGFAVLIGLRGRIGGPHWLNRLRKNSFAICRLTSAAKAATQNKPLIAALEALRYSKSGVKSTFSAALLRPPVKTQRHIVCVRPRPSLRDPWRIAFVHRLVLDAHTKLRHPKPEYSPRLAGA